MKQKEFQLKLDNVGIKGQIICGYGLIKDTSSMKLIFDTNMTLSKQFVGKENQGSFLYELAIHLLANLNGGKHSGIEKDIKLFQKEGIKGWEIKQ